MNTEYLTIQDSIDEFLRDCLAIGFTSRTVMSHRSNLKPWQTFLKEQGIENLTAITRDTILNYRYWLCGIYRTPTGQVMAVTTQYQKLKTLKVYLSFCVTTGRILFNPAADMPMPKLPKSLPRGILTTHQMKKLLKLPDTKTLLGFRDRIILELLYATGVRQQELITIKVRDCQLSERLIFIFSGKGRKQRFVPIGRKVCALLQEYLKTIRPALAHNHSNDTLIVNNKGGPLVGRMIHHIVSKYLKKLGFKSACHGLRHTCATHLLKGKANIRVIQSLLGHTNLSSTQIYTHVELGDIARAIQKAHPRESMTLEEDDSCATS